MSPSDGPVNVLEFEALARARMEPSAYDYFAGAAGDERTLLENRIGDDRPAVVSVVCVQGPRDDTRSGRACGITRLPRAGSHG